jgi:hypothetical protein
MTPMRELQKIQSYLNRFFGDMPLRRVDDDGFSLIDWVPSVDVEDLPDRRSSRISTSAKASAE